MKARSLLLLLVLASAHFSIVGLAGHDSGCTPTSANPNDIIVITLGDTYYLEERGDPFNTNPPIPGSGLLFNNPNSPLWDPDDVFFGEGTWMYREANGLAGLQRGGTGFTGPMFPPPFDPGTPFDPGDDIDAGVLVGTDQIDDQTCGHGPDTIIMGGAVRFDTGIGGPNLWSFVAWLLSQVPQLPPTPPQPPAPPPGCSPTWANPSEVIVVTVAGETYYVEERGNPANSNPPVPGSGLVLSEGTWVYREANGLWGLQRGGTGMTGPMFPPPVDPGTSGNPNDDVDFGLLIGTDPIDDETCGRGPDTIIMGGALRPFLPGPPDPWPTIREVQKEADELKRRANDLVNEPPQPNPGNNGGSGIDVQGLVPQADTDCVGQKGRLILIDMFEGAGETFVTFEGDGYGDVFARWTLSANTLTNGGNNYAMLVGAGDETMATMTWRSSSANTNGCFSLGTFGGNEIQFFYYGAVWGVAGSDSHTCSWETWAEGDVSLRGGISIKDLVLGSEVRYKYGQSAGCSDGTENYYDSELLLAAPDGTGWYAMPEKPVEECVQDWAPDLEAINTYCLKNAADNRELRACLADLILSLGKPTNCETWVHP